MLRTRVLTVLVVLPLVLACLFLAPPTLWALFAWLVLGLAAWEWARLVGFDRPESAFFIVAFLGLGAAWQWLPAARAWALPLDAFSLLFWCAIAPWWLGSRRRMAPKWLAALLGWLLLLAALAAVTRLRELPVPGTLSGGASTLLFLMAIAWVADIAAYFAGRTFGKHKLAPSISPGKSWEGVAGGLLAVTGYLLLLHACDTPLFSALHPLLLVVLGWALTGISIVGDLFESLLKRQAGMKDSSKLLPGHGGVLDRIDSLIALAPTAAALLFVYALTSTA